MTSLKRPRRSWAEEDTGEPAPPPSVRISYSNLPPESRQRLDGAVREWMSWHADQYPQGYRPPEVASGELSYEPGLLQLGQGTCPAFEDKPAPPERPPSGTVWFNIAYEKVGDVPQYDRTVDAALTYTHPKKQRANGRRRPATQQLVLAPAGGAGGDGAGAANCAGGGGASGTPAGRPAKRPRGGASQRCFNCGSYAHSMRDCWQPYNKELVEQMKREFDEAREGGAAYRSSAKRYFLPGAAGSGAAALEAQFEGLRAGQLTEGLRAALGIGPLDPPPWLQRMRALGLPPAYYIAASRRRGEGEEGEENGTAAAAAAAAPAPASAAGAAGAAVSAAAANGSAAEAANGVAEVLLTSSGEAQPVPEDFIPVPGTPGATRESDGEGGPDGGAGWQGVVVYAAQFPGLNAPAPEGANPRKWEAPQQQQQPEGGGGRGGQHGGAPPPVQHHHPHYWQGTPPPLPQHHPPPMVSAHQHHPPPPHQEAPPGFHAPHQQHQGW